MKMNSATSHNIDQDLLTRYLTGEANTEEARTVEDWRKSDSLNETSFIELETTLKTVDSISNSQKSNVNAFSIINKKIDSGYIPPDYITLPDSKSEKSGMSVVLKIAAAIIVLTGLAAAIWLITGNQGATEQKLLSAITTNDRNQVVLSDGTIVNLNKQTSLDYAAEFKEDERIVNLKGEAFFEVARNEQKPFKIIAGGSEIVVLGTSFSVSITSERVVVIVATGKVAFSPVDQEDKALILLPGDKGVFENSTGVVSVGKNNDPNFLAWKTRSFHFNETKLVDAVEIIRQVYGQEIKLENQALESCPITAEYSDYTFNELVEIMVLTIGKEITRDGSDITITGDGCE